MIQSQKVRMKICFIAPANNYHTKKWCKWFSKRKYEVHVISFIMDEIEDVTVHYINAKTNAAAKDINKIQYLFQAFKVKKIVNSINPDIINVHYATSYGTVAALSGIKGYFLSVWGSDIYQFPRKSFLHKMMLKFSLNRAKYIFSTSEVMAKETNKYTKKKIYITPFGVDMEMFSPSKRIKRKDQNFVVGTVKSLTPVYGIDYLLKAVAIIKNEHKDIPIKLRIAGKGEAEKDYKKLSEKLHINQDVEWLGFIPQEQAAKEWANMDLGVIYSIRESFGVSAIEAEACETPIIISDAPGLMEVTIPNKTSVVVQGENERLLAEAIIKLFYDKEKRMRMGKEGRKYVSERYEIDQCFKRIERYFIKNIANVER